MKASSARRQGCMHKVASDRSTKRSRSPWPKCPVPTCFRAGNLLSVVGQELVVRKADRDGDADRLGPAMEARRAGLGKASSIAGMAASSVPNITVGSGAHGKAGSRHDPGRNETMSYDFNLPASRVPGSQQPSSGDKQTPGKKPRAQLKKQVASKRLSLPPDFINVKVEKKPEVKKQETGWKQSKPSSQLINELVGWFGEENGEPKRGVMLINALLDLAQNPSQLNKLKDRVVTSIRANFAAEDIGSVLGKLDKIYGI